MGKTAVLLRGADGVRAFYDDDNVARFAEIVDEELDTMLTDWARRGAGTVYRDTSAAFGRAAFRWAGLSLSRSEVRIGESAEDLTFPWTRMLTRPATGVHVTWATGATENT